jgi:hypothetical protein
MKSQNSRSHVFCYFFCLMMEGSRSGSVQMTDLDPDPDVGGPKITDPTDLTPGPQHCFLGD